MRPPSDVTSSPIGYLLRVLVAGFALVLHPVLPGQSVAHDACKVRWEFDGDQLRRVVCDAGGDALAARDYRLEDSGWFRALLARPEPVPEHLLPHFLALSSGGGPLGDVERLVARSEIDLGGRARWARLMAEDATRGYQAWSPIDLWACLLEEQLQEDSGFGSPPFHVTGHDETLRQWRRDLPGDELASREAVLPAGSEMRFWYRQTSPTTADALHHAYQAALAHQIGRELTWAGLSFSPGQALDAQCIRELAQASACAWAGQLGCWRMHSFAIGRQGDRALIAICADLDVEKLAAWSDFPGADRSVELIPSATGGQNIYRFRSGNGKTHLVVAASRADLEQGWGAECGAPPRLGTGAETVAVSVRGLGGQGPDLHTYQRLDLHGSPDALDVTLTFESDETATDWQRALAAHLERLRKYQAVPRRFALPAPVRSGAELTYRAVPAAMLLHLVLARTPS